MDKSKNKPPEYLVFQRLSYRYFLALALIAVVVFASYSFIQSHLNNQKGDSRVVNLSGRQRMLSQQLSKQALNLSFTDQENNRLSLLKQISSTLELWEKTHLDLKNGTNDVDQERINSEEIIRKFELIEAPFQEMKRNAEVIIKILSENPDVDVAVIKSNITGILSAESQFLSGMDDVVFQYDQEASDKITELRRLENIILVIGLGVLFLELLFIFLPSARYVRQTIKALYESAQATEAKSEEVRRLFDDNEKSHAELKALNFAIDKALLFASIGLDGRIVYVSEKLLKFINYNNQRPRGSIAELLTSNESEQHLIDQSIRSLRSSVNVKEQSITTSDGEQKWLEISYIPVNRSGVQFDYLMICHDISASKLARKKIDIFNQKQFDKEIENQKIRSVKIVEAQEEERKRIAKDIHDSIGQMLTSLKFNIEGINLSNTERAAVKLDEIKLLASNVIKGVRLATFNLTPPELADYGVLVGIKKLVSQTAKLSGRNIIFEDKTNFDGRFESIVETNIYRICQEAVNNALKYAQSEIVVVSVSHDKDIFSVVVEDNGVGFDIDQIGESDSDQKENSGHMGLSFMRERADFINGRLFIRSEEKIGTRITLNVPISSDIHRTSISLDNEAPIESTAW